LNHVSPISLITAALLLAATPACSATVGIVSAQVLAPGIAWNSLRLQNTSASARLACRFGSPAILNDPSSFMLKPGDVLTWGGPSNGGVPQAALNCISDTNGTGLHIETK
jgi:hypothetical protein